MRRQGFTLVELAIVLVIIGLIMGMILKGQGLINSAKEKNLRGKIQNIIAAEYIYYDRYSNFTNDSAELINKHLISNGTFKNPFGGTIETKYNSTSGKFYIQASVPKWVAESLDNKTDDSDSSNGIIQYNSTQDPTTLKWFF